MHSALQSLARRINDDIIRCRPVRKCQKFSYRSTQYNVQFILLIYKYDEFMLEAMKLCGILAMSFMTHDDIRCLSS